MRQAALLSSYERLTEVFHLVLAEQRPETLLERIADAVAELVPYQALTIYEADALERVLVPVLARDRWAEEILGLRLPFGEGISGWVAERREPVLANAAHRDPRARTVPGTPAGEPEALIAVPLIARGSLKGVLNVYRLGADVAFTRDEFTLVRRLSDAAALALDNAQVRATLEHLAQTDPLTGLFNHRAFHERLRAALTGASRSGEPLALVMVDIDDFKRVNDIYGHALGDQVLAALADLLRRSVRTSDSVCRIGGEEFAIVMEAATVEKAFALSERLAGELHELEIEPVGKITVSVGVALAPEHAMNPRELSAYSEAAMMTAKAEGKDRAVVFDEHSSARPDNTGATGRDARTLAHLKMIQSLTAKLNRLNDVRAIGQTIANELRTLIDYHSCRVYTVEGDELVPVALRGELADYADETLEALSGLKLGDGITGTAAARGQALLIDDALACPFAREVPGTERIDESIIAAPMLSGSRVSGVITISKLGIGQFDEDDLRLLEVLAAHAAVAVENARLLEAQRREARHARSLLRLSHELSSSDQSDALFQRIVELTSEMLAAPQVSLWLQDRRDGRLRAFATTGYSSEQLALIHETSYERALAVRFLEPTEPRVLEAGQLAGVPLPLPLDGRRFALAPLCFARGRFGFLVAVGPQALDPKEVELLGGIADQAKLAIENAERVQERERSLLATIEALANAADANSAETSSHAHWIRDMALKVGRALGAEIDWRALELAALFHDIGKIGILSELLSKPGPLTDGERRIIELHPELGERILAPIVELGLVSAIVRHCHERWDGAGYPDGLAGDAIPTEARIIFVCDAFHAMISDRPYRKALSESEAKRRLLAGAGSQFDPDVVEVVLRLVEAETSSPAAQQLSLSGRSSAMPELALILKARTGKP